jgi:hypothetical protein
MRYLLSDHESAGRFGGNVRPLIQSGQLPCRVG